MLSLMILRLKIALGFIFNKEVLNIGVVQKKNIFIFLGADYGNLGDVAITYAQIKYLKERFIEYNIVEIPISKTIPGIKAVKRIIGKKDVVALIGGGNTGDIYDDIEWLRQLVILSFRKYRIIGFPQTFDFSNSLNGRICKYIAYMVYKKARNLYILAREENTFDVLSNDFKNIHFALAPDIVMTLDLRSQNKRKGVLFCLRSDKERAVSESQRSHIISRLSEKFSSVTFQDTQVNGVNVQNRFTKLQTVIELFRKQELVVTDRLHGMILCFITGTPALVLDNSNHKISACYHWIKGCGYIKMIDNLEAVDIFETNDNFEKTHNEILTSFNQLPCLQFH